MSQVSPGWYEDPDGKPCERYWNGTAWTLETRPILGMQKDYSAQTRYVTTGWKWTIGISFVVLVSILIWLGSEPEYWST